MELHLSQQEHTEETGGAMKGRWRRWRCWALPLLAGVALGLLLMTGIFSGPAAAVVPPYGMVCTEGTLVSEDPRVVEFSLRASDGYIYMTDGNSVYMWSYAVDGGPFQFPGPNLCVKEDDTVVVHLANDLPEPVSIMFPGQTAVHAGDDLSDPLAQPQFDPDLTSLTNSVPSGGDVTYSFKAEEPGTYLYHSGTSPHKQMQMGLVGALIIRPLMGDEFAYNDASTEFNPGLEFMLLLHEIDPDLHQAVELNKPYDITKLHFRYWTINGRSMLDTISPNGAPWFPSQPYAALMVVQPYDPESNPLPVLVRLLNAGLHNHPFHPHGSHELGIAQDGRLLKGPGGEDLAVERFTFSRTAGSGQTFDGLFRWADVEGWRPEGEPESGTQCSNSLDDDDDGKVNDGCPTSGILSPETGKQCKNATDDDFDGLVNDGCPADTKGETGAQCSDSLDDDNDGKVNDGCKQVGAAESGTQCDNAADDDGDSKVNDGCPKAPNPETGPQCSNDTDDDSDGKVNDGCPAGAIAPETDCDDDLDNDLDGKVNDGCPTAGADPIPVQLPGLQNLIFKDDVTVYGGSPYLGYQDELPVGVTSYNQCGEQYFPWHTHAVNEFQSFNEGFGGMGTLIAVFPPGGCP